jgi:hypothetical protein
MRHHLPDLQSRIISHYFLLVVIILLLIAFLFGHLLQEHIHEVNGRRDAIHAVGYLPDEALPKYIEAEEGHPPPDYETASTQLATIV